MKVQYYQVLFSLLSFYTSFSQPSSFSVSTGKEKIVIGEPFDLTLKATISKKDNIQWLIIDTFPHFEILNKAKVDTQINNEVFILQQKITLTSWDSGKWPIPSFVFSKTKKSKPIVIDVSFSPFNREQDYHDIKDILEVPKPERDVWYWYLFGAILLLLLFLLLFPSKKKNKDEEVKKPDENIYKTSLLRLDKLRAGNTSDPKVYYTELIDIFRDYLHKRKSIQSFSKTTDDLAIQISNLQLQGNNQKILLQNLRLSDLVKFARFQPPASEQKESLEIIRQSIIDIENIQ
ncbi:MAG: BatD family protein [Bacteroidota bacterium]|nr:BatD family protein [Bacteroidota bacterium]